MRDPANIKEVGSVPVANHTAECVLDCQYFYGRAGTIVDARGILDGKPPTVIGNWIDELKTQGVDSKSCHHMRELRPGVLLTACQPFAVITVNPGDGGSPAHPKVLYTGESDAFVHSARWPRAGKDDLVLIGGEKNFTGRCDGSNGEFAPIARRRSRGTSKSFGGPLDHLQPAGNGTTRTASRWRTTSAARCIGSRSTRRGRTAGWSRCPSTRTASASSRSGRDGKMKEQGFFPPLGGSSSSSKWAGKGNIVYSLDYDRGIDIIRWRGYHYVRAGAGLKRERGRVKGTNGVSAIPALNAAETAQQTSSRRSSRAGWSPGLCYLAATQ